MVMCNGRALHYFATDAWPTQTYINNYASVLFYTGRENLYERHRSQVIMSNITISNMGGA